MSVGERRDKIEALSEALAHMEIAGELLQSVGDPYLTATVAAQLQGEEAGWAFHSGSCLVDQVRAMMVAELDGKAS